MRYLRPRRHFGIALVLGLTFIQCNDDDGDKAPTQSDVSVDINQVAPILQTLQGALGDLNIVDLLTGGQVIEGEQGTLTLTATNFIFDGYSADGSQVLDGDLEVDLLASPLTIQGTLELSGAQNGTMEVDLEIMQDGEDFDLAGTLVYEGVEFDIAALVAALEAEDAGD